MPPPLERWMSQTGAAARPTRIRKSPRFDRVTGEIVLGDVMLALAAAAVDERDVVCLGEAAYAATEASGQTHEVRVVEVLVGTIHQATPPVAEAGSRVTQRVVGVQDHAIDTVIGAVQQLSIALRQFAGHLSQGKRLPRQEPLLLGRVPEGA